MGFNSAFKGLSVSQRKTSAGKPRSRWLDDVKNNLKKMCVRGWRRKKARDRDVVPNDNML